MADKSEIFLKEFVSAPTVRLTPQSQQKSEHDIKAAQAKVQRKTNSSYNAQMNQQNRQQAQLNKQAQSAQLAQQRQADKASADQQRRLDKAFRAGTKNVGSQAAGVTGGIGEGLQSIGEWASSVPTPGGILFVLLLLFFFIWAIVPVNGQYTRLQLLWKTLIGQTAVKGGVGDTIAGSTNTVTGAVAKNAANPVAAINPLLNIPDFSNGGIPLGM